MMQSNSFKKGQFLLAKSFFEKAIFANPKAFRNNLESRQLLFSSYYGKAKAEMSARLWEDAFQSLTQAVGLERSFTEEEKTTFSMGELQEVYIDRAKAFLKQGEPIRALDDCKLGY